jgi:hypothetical protein
LENLGNKRLARHFNFSILSFTSAIFSAETSPFETFFGTGGGGMETGDDLLP